MMQPKDNIATHTTAFQDMYRHLTNSKFVIPEFCTVGLLLSTLYTNFKDPNSWDFFIKGTQITETTILSNVINLLLDERHHQGLMLANPESILTVREHSSRNDERRWCRNCRKDGHTTDQC